MVSATNLPMSSANIWTNFVFLVIALVLAFYIIYYSIVPWHAGAGAGAANKSGLWQDPRPKALRRFISLTVFSLVCASLLNVVFYAQGVPSSEGGNNGSGPTLRIPNLQLGGWLALRSLSNIFEQLPFALLFLTLVNILQSRWYALHKYSTGHKLVSSSSSLNSDATEYKFPAFLGWKGKEGCSFFIAFLLIFIPILSNVVFSIGMSKYSQPLSSNDVVDLDNYNKIVKAVTILDAWHCVTVITAIADATISSFCLFQQMRKSQYYDLITAIISRIITPFLIVVALQTTIASSFHSFSNASESTLATLDFITSFLTTLVVTAATGLLLNCYSRPQRWMLASTQVSTGLGPKTIRLGDVSPVTIELPELPKLSYLPSRDNMA